MEEYRKNFVLCLTKMVILPNRSFNQVYICCFIPDTLGNPLNGLYFLRCVFLLLTTMLNIDLFSTTLQPTAVIFGAGLQIPNQQVHHKFPPVSPNVFNTMKLSSVALIAAALAGIADSAIAAPLHAGALEAVNSFDDHDLDIYSGLALPEREVDDELVDNLFTRTRFSGDQHAQKLAEACHSTVKACLTAEEDNLKAYEVTEDQTFLKKARGHQSTAAQYKKKAKQHEADKKTMSSGTATEPEVKEAVARSKKYSNGVKNANRCKERAKKSSEEAIRAASQAHRLEAAKTLHGMWGSSKGR